MSKTRKEKKSEYIEGIADIEFQLPSSRLSTYTYTHPSIYTFYFEFLFGKCLLQKTNFQ